MKKMRIGTATLTMAVIGMASLSSAVASDGNDTWIPAEVQGYCEEYGEMYGICPELLMAMIETESGGQENAKNGGCIGLMQIYGKYHGERMRRLGVSDLYDARSNVLVGTDYLAELFAEYGDPALALDVYNGNSKAWANYENGVLSKYAEKILNRSQELERIHGK